MSGKPRGSVWTPDRIAALSALLDALPADRIRLMQAQYPDLTRSQIDGQTLRLKGLRTTQQRADDNPAAALWAARRDEAIASVTKAAPVIEIVDVPPVDYAPVRYKPNPCWIVSSDHHWPLADKRVEAIILQHIKALRPRGYILDGDGPDILALSKYPKDARHGKSWALREEQHEAKSWWRAVHQLGQEWGMELYETEANHSGNDRDSRWRRYLNDRCPELFGLDGFEEVMAYERFFHPPDVPVQMVEEVVIANDLRVRHGEIVRKHGGYSSRAHGDKWQASIMHGHTHRIGSSVKRRPGIPGVRPDEYLRTYEIGCVCHVDADYCPGADWAQGFAVIWVDDATDSYSVELVQVIDGRATSSALRGTLAA